MTDSMDIDFVDMSDHVLHQQPIQEFALDTLNIISKPNISHFNSGQFAMLVDSRLKPIIMSLPGDMHLVIKDVILADGISVTNLLTKILGWYQVECEYNLRLYVTSNTGDKARDDRLVLIKATQIGDHCSVISCDQMRDLHLHWQKDVTFIEIPISTAVNEFCAIDFMCTDDNESPKNLLFNFMSVWFKNHDPMNVVIGAPIYCNQQDMFAARSRRIEFNIDPVTFEVVFN